MEVNEFSARTETNESPGLRERLGIILRIKINPWIHRIYISVKSSHASNSLLEVSGRLRQEKREAD